MGFYGYNPHFGWIRFDEDQITTVDPCIVDIAMKNEHTVIKIPGGFRDAVERKEVSVGNINYLPRIKHAYHVSSRSTKEIGTCQWIAAVMLINEMNEYEATKMMNFMKKCPERVNWKPMFKGKDSLSNMLTMVTNYELRKVKERTSNYIPFLMSTNEGKYVCVVTDNNYAEKHVIGIDCEADPKLIWDSSEKQAMELTHENLHRCTGSGNYCLKIRTIGKIVQKDCTLGKKSLSQEPMI